jgi:ABC-2 type transport system ATP-binding protein
MPMPAIHLENLGKTYRNGWKKTGGVAALKNLSLEVREGEIFGFLGPNGAGKTTTIHLLLDLMRPTSGSARMFDQPAGDAKVRRRLGYLPESVNLHRYYTGRGLLKFYAALTDIPPARRGGRIDELLQLLKLEEAADRPVTKYSKGMLQRLGFAQALLHEPDLIILDEPTSSLDPVGRKEFRDILLQLKRQGKTVFISSHILSEVESVCDRVAIMEKGQLKRIGTLQELSAPKSVKLTVRGVRGALLDALATTSAEITFAREEAVIKCNDPATRAQVEKLLAEHQLSAERTEVETQSLEDIFFSALTQKKET